MPLCGCQNYYDQQKKFYLEKGRELFNRGDYMTAAEKFQNALVFDDRYADAMYMTGQCNLEIENYKTAVEWLQKAGAEQPNNLEIKVKIAEAYLAWGRPKLTVLSYDAILSIDPKNTGARKVKMEFLVQKDRLTEAENLINDYLLQEEKQDTRFYKVLTEYYIKKTQYSEAVKTVLEHFTFSNYWMKTITNLIQKLEENNSNAELIKIYNKVIEQAPNKVPYQEALSSLYRKAKDKDREDQLFQKLLQSNPKVLQVKVNYIDFLMYYKQQSQAKAFLNAQLKEHPGDIVLTKSLINYYVCTQQIDTAVRVIQESLSMLLPGTNSYVELQNMLAALYFDNGDFDMAATIAKEVVRQSKSNRDARFLLCKINLIQGDMYRVIGELRLLIRENQNIAEFHYYLGLVHEIRDETILAEQEFRDALTISPNYRDALKKWLAVYPTQGVLDEVETRVNKYLISNPADQEIVALRDEILKKKEGMLTSSNLTQRQKTLSLPGLP
jgi:tetratricopeptide (TPR) repeat protein